MIKVGDNVLITYGRGEIVPPTPVWCIGWRGKIIRINRQSVTVEFEVNEPDRPTLRRYIDHSNIKVIE